MALPYPRQPTPQFTEALPTLVKPITLFNQNTEVEAMVVSPNVPFWRFQEGRVEEAVADLSRAVEMSDPSPASLHYLAKALKVGISPVVLMSCFGVQEFALLCRWVSETQWFGSGMRSTRLRQTDLQRSRTTGSKNVLPILFVERSVNGVKRVQLDFSIWCGCHEKS